MSNTLVEDFRKAVLKTLTEFDGVEPQMPSIDNTVDILEGFDVNSGEMFELNNIEDNDALAEHFTLLAQRDFNIRELAMDFFKEKQGKLIDFLKWLEAAGYAKSCDKIFFIDNTKEPFVLDKTN